ncbi:MAG: hypothetical protein A2504_00850 [Bdellovibrionales bacterium RIFOXYD12_FULL_39_22]|nr:MAG: hypothetical protein A2385_03470 [Bdellovibrionales bacterium RIFOXYB1_FULL_39_21]OFZ47119.1 MAG: hypothetical protein A2404_15460 [Bdellovibrionales bacterium RIFOXYC1_FULL_39_130]OFZ93318.1 MAG: hypothetical protein A2504_00850 [Bdellovibrionales bacterium RIFOXYD12_FULL_39_22]HLE10006.1 transglycosylase SLT domain-containing protein [Bacteriovoracaceae bacterium]
MFKTKQSGAYIKSFFHKKEKIISAFWAALLLLSLSSSAIEIKLDNDLNLRADTPATDEVLLDKIATLPRGTILTIPDKYFPKELKGASEHALNFWLANHHKLKRFPHEDGKIKRDYFVPVTVVSTPDNRLPPGTIGEVNVGALARERDLQLLATEETLLYPTTPPQRMDAITPSTPLAQLSVADPLPICPVEFIPNAASEKLARDVAEILAQKNVERTKMATIRNYKEICLVANNYNSTCAPPPFEKFLQSLHEEAKFNGIPANLLLAMMTKESVGRCGATNDEDSGSKSLGLFQINTKTYNKRYCTNKANPSCLTHPITNLKEAIKILVAKYKRVNDFYPRASDNEIEWKSLDPNKRNLWRKALAAYNGGEGYVFQAYNDLVSFNRKYQTNFDPDNWAHRKLFLFRMMLEKNYQEWRFPNRYKYRRSSKNAISNLVFAETIAGEQDGDASLIGAWENSSDCRKEAPQQYDEQNVRL